MPRRYRRRHPGPPGTYAIEAIGVDRVKIGRTRDREGRLLKLQNTSPVEIKMIAWSDLDCEAALHRQLAAFRSHGEWFHLNDSVRSLLFSQLTPFLIPISTLALSVHFCRFQRCKRCGLVGHQTVTCTMGGMVPRDPVRSHKPYKVGSERRPTRCGVCGEPGHIAVSCSKIKSRSG